MGQYAMTGGATGIGAAIKDQLIADGHSVVVVDIKGADIEADLSNREGRQHAIDRLQQHCADGLDGFVTCAGIGANVPKNRLIASVNYYGTVELVEGVRELLEKRQGSVVLISSNSAPMSTDSSYVDLLLDSDEGSALDAAEAAETQQVYSGSKQAVTRWMRRNTARFAALGVRLNAIAPGYTQTPMTESVEKDPTYGPKIREFLATIPIGRPGKPQDMADATKFLLSDSAKFICGSILFVDGGHDAMLRPDQF